MDDSKAECCFPDGMAPRLDWSGPDAQRIDDD